MNNVLEQKEIFGGTTTKYVISLKHDSGRDLIDLRKWILFPNATEHFPSKTKGICITIEAWRRIIPAIQELLSANTK